MKVTILITHQVSFFELACATELFALPRPELENWYDTQVLSLTPVAEKSTFGLSVSCQAVEHLPETDLLVIPSHSTHEHQPDTKLADAVMAHNQNGGRIISFCSGSFLLAHLGLLDHRQATTHWRYAAQFKKCFPHINLNDDILYSYDGRIGCSAGSAAAIDLGLEVIRQDHGYQIANHVARRFVLPAHRQGGQSQFIDVPLSENQSRLSQVLDWACKNLSKDITVSDLAKQANMTRRTFDRQFKNNYQMTPLNWLNQRKLDRARNLLESTTMSIESIATRSGFDNAITLRHNFKKHLSTSPSKYRTQFAKQLVP